MLKLQRTAWMITGLAAIQVQARGESAIAFFMGFGLFFMALLVIFVLISRSRKRTRPGEEDKR